VPSNKQRLSKVWVLFLDEAAQNSANMDSFRSCVQGSGVGGVKLGKARTTAVVGAGGSDTIAHYWDQQPGLLSAQFQVGAELSEAITTENKSGKVGTGPNTGQAFLEAYLRAIGAVNGNKAGVEFWGKELDMRCKPHCGGDLLETFLSKHFCLCYDGEKLLDEAGIETGVNTQGGKDIVLDLRFDANLQPAVGAAPIGHANARCNAKRIMFLIEYHCQLHVRDNEVSRSF